MKQERVTDKSTSPFSPVPSKLVNSHYGLLGLHPSASVVDIRRSYRELSKRYHPDTTDLPTAEATAKFQQLNEAYATLSNPELRSLYNNKIGYSPFHVIQAPLESQQRKPSPRKWSNSAYLDPTDRPLSPGELFALFILGLTFVGCLIIAIFIGLTRGDTALQVSNLTKINSCAVANFQTLLKILF